jgi:hypothetical protein
MRNSGAPYPIVSGGAPPRRKFAALSTSLSVLFMF